MGEHEVQQESAYTKRFFHLVWIGVAVATVVLIAIGLRLSNNVSTPSTQPSQGTEWAYKSPYAWSLFFASVIASLVAAGLVYLLSIALIGWWKQQQSKAFFAQLFAGWHIGGIREFGDGKTLSWDAVIKSATRRIDIVVQGWDGLIKQNHTVWKEFFARGGDVNLYIPAIGTDNSPATLPHMAKRLGWDLNDQIKEITSTKSELESARAAAVAIGKVANVGTLAVYTIEPMIWYCLIVVDDCAAYLSPYQHREDRTKPPVLELQLGCFPEFRKWIKKELGALEELHDAATKR